MVGRAQQCHYTQTINNVKKGQEKDWWDQVSAAEKSEIEEGLAQADRGDVVPPKEVMAKYK